MTSSSSMLTTAAGSDVDDDVGRKCIHDASDARRGFPVARNKFSSAMFLVTSKQ